MKPYIVVILLLLGSHAHIFAQQLPLFEQYRNMGFIVNPAISGSEEEETVGIFYRYQWTNIPGAPQTGFITYDTHRLMYDYNMAVSGYIVHDRTGPTMTNGVAGNYAYHIEIPSYGSSSHFISIGAQLGLYQHRLNGDQLIVTDLDDQLVIGDRKSAFLPEIGAGFYYYNEYMGIGFSVPQILGLTSNFNLDGQLSPIKRERHMYGMAYGKIPIGYNEESFIMPSVWAKYSIHSPLHLNFNLKMILAEKFLVGFGYSTSNMITGEIGALINQKYKFGYSYSTQFTEWTTFLGDSHELFFIYVIESEKFNWY